MAVFAGCTARYVAGWTGRRSGRHAHDIADAYTCVNRSSDSKPVTLLTTRRNAAVREFGTTEIWRSGIARGGHKRTWNAIGMANLATDVVGHRNVWSDQRASRHNLRQAVKRGRSNIYAMASAAIGGNATVAKHAAGKTAEVAERVSCRVAVFATQCTHRNMTG